MLSFSLVSCNNFQEIEDLDDLGDRLWKTHRSLDESYVVSKNISGRKKFTVLQEYDDYEAITLQKDTERVLLKLGFSVIRPPARKIVEKSSGKVNSSTTATVTKADELNKDMLKAGAIVEKYYELGKTPADYLVLTDSKQNIFKLVDKKTKEILAIEKTYYLSEFMTDSHYREQVYDLFTTIGFEVKRTKTPKQQVEENNSTETIDDVEEGDQNQIVSHKFLTYKNLPNKPVFTVIQTQVVGQTAKKYSTEAEKMLLEIGVPVVRPPKFKYVEKQISNIDSATTKKSTDTSARSDELNKGKLSSGETTETYLSYHETIADYVFFIDSKVRSFKLVNKKTEEILAIEELGLLTKYNKKEKREELSQLLESLELVSRKNSI